LQIGARCGEIHAAMLPIGAYAPRWFMRPQHMDPADAVRAFSALGAERFIAMHWGTFKLPTRICANRLSSCAKRGSARTSPMTR
jgi:L-ascorbate metabolism protein UlaG (beta-lactamase superfamily)